MNIGHTLNSLRKMKSLTLQDLHDRTGLSVPYLSLLEKNKRSASLDSLEKLSKALSVPVAVIVFLSATDEELNDGSETLANLKNGLKQYVEEQVH